MELLSAQDPQRHRFRCDLAILLPSGSDAEEAEVPWSNKDMLHIMT